MSLGVKTTSQCNSMKSSSVRSPADGEEQFPSETHDEDHKRHDSNNMPLTEAGLYTSTKCSSESPASSEQGSPPYFRWAKSLHNLLKDLEGTQLFQQYLEQEKQSNASLEFWFACEGVKRPESQKMLPNIIKAINRNFVCGMPEISRETKEEIAKKIASNVDLDKTIFDKAQKEVETAIRRTTYPNFIRSDLYMQHIQHVQSSAACHTPENEVRESSSEVVPLKNVESKSSKEVQTKTPLASLNLKDTRESLDVLQTVFEDSELQLTTCNRLSMTRKSLFQWRKLPDTIGKLKPESQAGHYLKSSTPGFNYCYAKYAAYLPPSAQDSELQSLSSDAQTDDTMSVVSSSTTTDCDMVCNKKCNQKKSKHHKTLKSIVPFNNDGLLHSNFIPRPDRMPEKKQLSPEEFAALLTKKLNKVREEREIEERLNENLQEEKRAQSILDDHVSRVFDDSAHQTPSPSLGCLTPSASQLPQELPVKCREAFTGASINQTQGSNFSYLYQYNAPCLDGGRHRRDLDSFSNDSGADLVTDYSISRSASFQHHHHSYHSVEPPFDHSLSRCARDSRRSSGKKLSSTDCGSSCFDSGSSGIDVASSSTTSREKVTTWLEMKKYPDKDLPFHQRKSSPSISPVLDQSSKKPVMYNNSSNKLLDTGSTAWPVSANSACSSFVESAFFCRGLHNNQPAQPIVQDPSMPPLSTPDTSSQLFETSRRLDMLKQKSKKSRKSYPVSAPVNNLPSSSGDKIPVAYCYGRGTVPYLSKLPGKNIILKQFKSLLSKKGNFRYYFKKANEDFGVVFEEVTDDAEVLPLWEGKIFCLIEQIE